MKQITMRELQLSNDWLQELPVKLTRYGRVIALIVEPDQYELNPKLRKKAEMLRNKKLGKVDTFDSPSAPKLTEILKDFRKVRKLDPAPGLSKKEQAGRGKGKKIGYGLAFGKDYQARKPNL